MRVTVQEISQTTGQAFQADECELINVFGDGRADPAYWEAVIELVHGSGEYRLGGGGSPLVVVLRLADEAEA